MELNMKAGDFKDLLNMVALPKDAKTALFNPVAPTFYPDGRISVISKNSGVVARIQMRDQNISGITEETKIPLQPLKLKEYVDLFNDNDEISFIYDKDAAEINLFGVTNGIEKTATLSSIVADEVKTTLDVFPMKFDDNGNPLFKGGQITPNVSATMNVDFFKDQISYCDKVKADPKIYYIEFDGNEGKITTKVGDPKSRDKDKIKAVAEAPEVIGMGAVSYALGFEEVMNNLDGPIDLLTIGGGPLWISQKTDTTKAEFLISPSVMKGGK